jgi:hypothetical protein
MSAKAPKAKKALTVSKGDAKHYNQQRMIELWEKGKSIREIAEDQKCSRVYAHRVLTTKAPDLYKKGQESRAKARG